MKKLLILIALLYSSQIFGQLNIMTVGKFKNCPGEPDTLMAVGDTSYVWYLTDQPDSILSTENVLVVMVEASYDPLYVTVATPTDTMNYTYLANSEFCYCQVYVPNRFTPDGDLFNEEFFAVINCDEVLGVRMTICNRMGKIVFDQTEYNAPAWNGRFNNEGPILRDDVYGWWVSIARAGGEDLHLNGFVVLAK